MSKISFRKIISTLLCAVLVLTFAGNSAINADEDAKTVRVGWYESPFNVTGENGRRSGYAYDFQCKIAGYTGWKYEYVEGSWPELLQMLLRGEIDMLSDVSYTEERAAKILYPSIPMGQETYYVYIDFNNSEIRPDDLSTLNGKRVGVTQNSIQAGIYQEWEAQRGISSQIVELGGSENESLQMLRNGELDAFVSLDSYGNVDYLTPVAMVGSSQFYFAVSGSRPDLLSELETALFAIQAEDRYYAEHLYDKYLNHSGAEMFLNKSEIEWLTAHGPIRVGYQDNYLAFCASDPATGELTGALNDYLDFAASGMRNTNLEFETISFPTASDAMTALCNGEIDCMFPANLTAYDSETMGVVMSNPMMNTEMLAVVRATDQKSFFQKSEKTVAVNAGNPNYDLFLEENFPTWNVIHYEDTPACLRAVAAGEADCVLISNYRFSNISSLCKSLDLTTVSSGVDMDYCFAIKEGNTTLYSIMAKVTGVVPESVTHSSLNYYAAEDAKMTLSRYISENLGIIMTIVSAVLLLFLILTARNLHLVRKTNKEEKEIKNLDQRANYDALTSVRNKGAFTDYVGAIQDRIKDGEDVDVAVCIFDCNNLKTINDKYGHNKGDEYIKNACHFICTTFRRSAVFRIGGDEFAAVLMNDDFMRKEELIDIFTQQQDEISASTDEPWNQLHIAMGLAVFEPDKDKTLNDTIMRADALMYENKRIWKKENGGARK